MTDEVQTLVNPTTVRAGCPVPTVGDWQGAPPLRAWPPTGFLLLVARGVTAAAGPLATVCAKEKKKSRPARRSWCPVS